MVCRSPSMSDSPINNRPCNSPNQRDRSHNNFPLQQGCNETSDAGEQHQNKPERPVTFWDNLRLAMNRAMRAWFCHTRRSGLTTQAQRPSPWDALITTAMISPRDHDRSAFSACDSCLLTEREGQRQDLRCKSDRESGGKMQKLRRRR